MVQEFEEVSRVRTGGKFEKHMYYRRPRTGEQAGWIVVQGTNAGRIEDLTSRGFEPLFKYGTIEQWEKKTGRYVSDLGPVGKWMPLFDAGGAIEFPPDQVMTYRWYREVPVPGKTAGELFPQLKGHSVKEYQCPACKHHPFLKQDGVGGLNHLAAHLTLAHNWAPEQVIKYGERTGLDFQEIYVHEEKAYSFEDEGARLSCDDCDYVVADDSKNPAASLRMHQRSAHKPFEVAVEA